VKLAGVLLAALLALSPGGAAAFPDRFVDPDDGQLDLSGYLLEHRGALAVPIVVTEPAVGYGGGLGLIWFSESMRALAQKAQAEGRAPPPPDIYGGAFIATENGTRAGALGARLSFAEDRWRYRGAVAAMRLELDFFGIGGALAPGIGKVGYQLEGIASFQELTRRLGRSDAFLGVRWVYLDLANTLGADAPDALHERQRSRRSSGLGATLAYDTRDNILWTTRGLDLSLDATLYAPAIGSQTRFDTYRAHAFGYWPVGSKLVVALRGDYRAARGDVPFYQLPFVDLRGVPAARYQNENVAVVEGEARYQLTPRWIALAFAGVARDWGSESFASAPSVVTRGVGFRYLVARRLGLTAGIDFAWGPERQAFYI
jgi:hypothetical protein